MNVDRAAIKQDLIFVNQMLNAWDFIGVADLVDDEYDCLAPTLTRLLHEGCHPSVVRRYLQSEIDDHFGMKDHVTKSEIKDFVVTLFEGWRRRRSV